MKRTEEILNNFKDLNGVLVKSKDELKKVLADNDTAFYLYVLVADEKAKYVIGEGTTSRGHFLFGNMAAPGHMKAGTRALLESQVEEKEYIIFPVAPDEKGNKPKDITVTEQKIKDFCPEFNEQTTYEKNTDLFNARLDQLEGQLNSTRRELFVACKPIIFATGCEMNAWKKYVLEGESSEFCQDINLIFNNFYTDL